MKLDVRKEIAEITKTPYAIVGIVVFFVFMCAVPVFFVFLPVVVIFLVILYKVGENTQAKAIKAANRKLGGEVSKLLIVENMELASTLVLNDWGVFYFPAGNPQVEMAWSEIDSVTETGLSMLEFKAGAKKLEVDLAVGRYLIVTWALYEKLSNRCHFLIEPKTGNSLVLERLAHEPKEWKSVKLRVDDDGIEYDGNKMSWSDMVSVVEEEVFHHDSMLTKALSFFDGSTKFAVGSNHVGNGTGLPGSSAYDYLKLVTKEKLNRKASFLATAALPYKRALDEFKRSWDALKAAFAFAVKNNNYAVIEPRFKEMLMIVDRFGLGDEKCVQEFFHDYALLLQRAGRSDESEALERRVNIKIE